MKISNIASIISCVNAIPLHIFIHFYDRYTAIRYTTIPPTILDDVSDNPNSTVTVANSALPTVEDKTVEDATVEDATVTPTTNTPAYYEFTTRTHDFDHSTESGWSTSIPGHQNLYGADAPLPPYRPNEKTLIQRAAKAMAEQVAKAQEETFTTESTPNSRHRIHTQCNIL